ncbi:CorA metal ion transporter [Dispira parvispora]|uniref:CorA metal ion transporter n=1 Tax=Dispira parvispora TaxID=1520584 RepID=A0A9W8B057_9FUNG|nr:CorA metal ion transporter [Dispira parvispora]
MGNQTKRTCAETSSGTESDKEDPGAKETTRLLPKVDKTTDRASPLDAQFTQVLHVGDPVSSGSRQGAPPIPTAASTPSQSRPRRRKMSKLRKHRSQQSFISNEPREEHQPRWDSPSHSGRQHWPADLLPAFPTRSTTFNTSRDTNYTPRRRWWNAVEATRTASSLTVGPIGLTSAISPYTSSSGSSASSLVHNGGGPTIGTTHSEGALLNHVEFVCGAGENNDEAEDEGRSTAKASTSSSNSGTTTSSTKPPTSGGAKEPTLKSNLLPCHTAADPRRPIPSYAAISSPPPLDSHPSTHSISADSTPSSVHPNAIDNRTGTSYPECEPLLPTSRVNSQHPTPTDRFTRWLGNGAPARRAIPPHLYHEKLRPFSPGVRRDAPYSFDGSSPSVADPRLPPSTAKRNGGIPPSGYMSDASTGHISRQSSSIFVPLPSAHGAESGITPSGRSKVEIGPDWEAIRYFTQHGDIPPAQDPSGMVSTNPVDSLFGGYSGNLTDDSCYVDDETFLDPHFRFTYFSPSIGTIRARELLDLQTPQQSLEELLSASKQCFWIDVLAPTVRDMMVLSRFFHIHPLTVEDILTEDAREKCETFQNYYFINFRTFQMDPSGEQYLDPISMYMVVLKEGIISFHSHVNPHLRHVLRRIRHMLNATTITPDWINYALIDDITDHFQPVMRLVETEVDSVDELVLILNESEQSDMLRRIGLARKTVISLLRLLGNKPDVVRSLMKRFEANYTGTGTFHTQETQLYLGDIQDHLLTMIQNTNHYEAILSRSHANYLAQISFEITQTSNRTNDVVAKLSAIASILVPLNIVTGLWGMNVPVPGQETADLQWFTLIVLMLAVFAGVVLFISRRSFVWFEK